MFSPRHADRLLGRLTQSPSQWVMTALSLGVKRPMRATDDPSPSSAEFIIHEAIRLLPHTLTACNLIN
jgi:hypothetical protein